MLKGKKRYLIPGALLLLLVAYLVVNHVTSPSFVTPRFEKELSRKWNADVELYDVEFGVLRGVRIGTLTILPESSSKDEPPVTLNGLHIHHRHAKLLTGDYDISSVTVERIEASLAESDITWLKQLSEKMRKKTEPMDVADTTVKDGTITVAAGKNGSPVSVTGLHLETHQDRPGEKVTGEGYFTFGSEIVQFNFLSYPERKRTRATVSFRDFGLESAPLQAFLGWDATVRTLNLSGTAEGRISLRRAGDTGQGPHVSGAVTFSDVSVAHKRWKVKAQNISGRIEITGKAFDVQRLSGDLAGGHFSLSGLNVRFGEGTLNSVSVSGRAVDLDPTKLPLKALPADMAAKVEEAELQSGKVDVEASGIWRAEQGTEWKADVSARELRLTMPQLKTEASSVSVDATVASEGYVTIHDASAQIYDGRVEVRGALGWREGELNPRKLELTFTDIPPAERLIERIPSPVPEIAAALGPQDARCSGAVRFGDAGTRLNLRVVAAQLRPSDLSYPLRDASFHVRWNSRGNRVRIPRLRARHGSGLLHGRASVAYGEETRLTLMLDGDHLAIDDNLLSLAPEAVRKNRAEWRPAGHIDFRLRMLHRKLGNISRNNILQDVSGDVTLRNVSVRHPERGPVAEGLQGHIGFGPGGVHVHGVAGHIFGVTGSVSGEVRIAEQTRADLRFHTDRTHLTPRLKKRCPAPLAAILKGLDTGGEFQALRVGDLDIEKGSASLVRRGQKFHLNDGRFALCNGSLEVPEATLQLEDSSWNATVQLSYLELESVLIELGISGQRMPSGILQGDVSLEGTGFSMKTLSTTGEISVSRGQLYDIPVMLSVFNFLNLSLARGESITRAYGSFRIEDQMLHIEDLLLAGSAMPVYVTGKVTLDPAKSLKKQQVNLLLSIVSPQGILDNIPVINWVKQLTLDQIRKYVIQARVEGTVDDYHVSGVASQVSAPITALWSLLQKVSPPETGAAPNERP